ncbi:MAG: hypothetical protein QXM38_04150 [Candidatus Aenigmatarchaeota archaeon]
MSKAKKAEKAEKNSATKVEEKAPEDLKKKVDSLIDIIEELSSNVDKSGALEVENMIDSKLKEMNEKFELKFQDIKNALDNIEKKTSRSKTKEDISMLMEEFKKSLEPRFVNLEEKLKLLDKLEMISFPQQSETNSNKEMSENSLKYGSNNDIEIMKRNISEIAQSISSLKDQMDAVRSAVKVQGMLDAEDIRKLEHVLSSIYEMIPQKNVIDNFRLVTREINDLKGKIEEFKNKLEEFRERQEEDYDNIGSRIETLVKYINALVEEKDRNFSELNKISTDNYSRIINIEKNLEYISKYIKELQEQVNRQNEKIKSIEESNRRLNVLVSKDDVKILNENMKRYFEQNKMYFHEMSKTIDNMQKRFEQKLLEQNNFSRDKLERLERIIDENMKKNREMIKLIYDEKKSFENILNERKQKIINIIKELRR